MVASKPLGPGSSPVMQHLPSLIPATLVASALLAAPSVPAQNTLETLPELEGLDLARTPLLFDEPGDGNVWVSGATWKGSFGPEGALYVPFFGSEAPRSYGLRFGPPAVSIDGDRWFAAEGTAASVEGRRVVMDHGPVREIYTVDEERIEQSFVFDSVPSRGELVLRTAVTTDLAVEARDGGFRFSTDLGDVHYGRALAIDAGGRTRDLVQEWVDGGIEITVPAEFLAEAELPLTIDPVVLTFAVTNDPRTQVLVDVAYDAPSGKYLIVYAQQFSVTDLDHYGVFVDAVSSTVGSTVTFDSTTASWGVPNLANCFFSSTFLCVAQVGLGGSDRDIWGRTRSATTGALGPQFQISIGNGDHSLPDVGGYGNDVNSSYSFMVVWQRDQFAGGDSDILARGVTSAGTLVGNQTGIALGQTIDDERPTISIRTGPPSFLTSDHQYMVVWERRLTGFDRDIWARVVDFDVDPSGHDEFAAYTFSDTYRAAVSSAALVPQTSEQMWMLVFSRAVQSHAEIFAVVATDGDADNARSIPSMQNLDLGTILTQPRIAFDGQDYLVAYRARSPMSTGDDFYLTALNMTPDTGELRSGLAERRSPIVAPGGLGQSLTIASQYEGGAPLGSRALSAYVRVDPTSGVTNVGASVVIEATDPVLGAQYCSATANSTGRSSWIRASGSQIASDRNVHLSCSDLPSNAFGYFLVAPSSGFTANPGGSAGHLCLGNSIGRFSNFVASSGSAGVLDLSVDPFQLPSPTGSVSASAGEAWYFQCWSRDAVGGVATSNFSNAVEVYFL